MYTCIVIKYNIYYGGKTNEIFTLKNKEDIIKS